MLAARAVSRFDIAAWFVLVSSSVTSSILFPPKSCNTLLATLFPPVLAEKGVEQLIPDEELLNEGCHGFICLTLLDPLLSHRGIC